MKTISPEAREIFDDILTKTVHALPPEFKQYVFDKLEGTFPYAGSDFQLTLILDTNILFQAVRAKVLSGKRTFFEKLSANPRLQICAPPKLEEEIMAKISQKFPGHKDTAKIKIEDAHNAAREILDGVEIIDEIDAESMKKAHAELDKRDEDDVPFLGLCFSIKAAGILTNDKDIKDGSSVRAWDTAEAGRVITVIDKGTMCFAVTAVSVHFATVLIREVILSVWAVITFLAQKAFEIVHAGAKLLERVPTIITIIATGIAVYYEYKTGHIRNLSKKLLKIIKEIGDAIWQFLQLLAEYSGVGIAGLGILFDYHQQAYDEAAMVQG